METIGYGKIGIAVVAGLLALTGTFTALRDVAGRLDADRASAAAPAATGRVSSTFSPGPRLGDLRSVFASADEVSVTLEGTGGASVSTGAVGSGGSAQAEQRIELEGDGAFRIDQRARVTGGSDGADRAQRRRDRNSDRRSGDGICNLPAMC